MSEGPVTLSTGTSFAAGAVAACMAVTVTNPIEVAKTRLQLQGELSASTSAPRIYKNPLQSMRIIATKEGFKGIQSGLFPAYFYQVMLNGVRLGCYEPVRRLTNQAFGIDPHERNHLIGIGVGAFTGAVGAFLGSPFYLVKVRMQSYSPTMPVGEQTYYRSVYNGLSSLWKQGGFKSLYRGVSAACTRTAIGSSVQLPIYHVTSALIDDTGLIGPGLTRTLCSSIAAGVGVAFVMSPPDVIMTRMYNQQGDLYTGLVDCFTKTVRSEGLFALYKGFGANALRIGPHTILSLTFLEYTMKFARWIEDVPLN